MSARQRFSALLEVDRDEQVDELVRLAANAEIGLTVNTHPSHPEGEESDPASSGDVCANCTQAHGPLDECALGALAGVVRDRWEGLDDRPDITPRCWRRSAPITSGICFARRSTGSRAS